MCHPEKCFSLEWCAILEHVSDWHCANFVLSKLYVIMQDPEAYNFVQRDQKYKAKQAALILFVCFFSSKCIGLLQMH